ncbi:MAG: hypothetical protein A2X49_03315 [Lentisphaerae bacterium GWF2_52_8]|nr:MAG: hypothetical protein A2X49_03315 [Lentisphaerae bacterium GWF2_52_8]
MIRKLSSFARYQLLIALFIYIFGVTVFSIYNYRSSRQDIYREVDKLLKAGAQGATHILGDDFHDLAVTPEAVSEKEDKKNILLLTRFSDSMNLRYVYTTIILGNKIYFTSSSATAEELKTGKYTRYFEQYDDAPEELRQVFKSGSPVYAEYADKWGVFRSVFIPLKNSKGQTYVACADIEIAVLAQKLNDSLFRTLSLAAIFILLAMPLVIVHFSIEHAQKQTLKEKQGQLAHAGRLTALGEMAAGIAHEINQPLCVIRGYLELLQAMLKNEPVIKERQLESAFEIGIKSVDRASAIINHMRSFVRVKNSEAKLIKLQEPIDSALSFFNEQIRLHNIELVKNYADNIPLVHMDMQRFEQVVVNLISNARFAVDEKGSEKGRSFKKKIELSLRHDPVKQELVFEIRDNGTGMAPEIVKHCTEPFFTTKKPGEGTGLGLSIVNSIVEEFSGRFEAESTVGEGSSFRIFLPVSSPRD